MEILYHCRAGLDAHKKTVVAGIGRLGPDKQPEGLVQTFGTMTADRLELADWLAAHAVVHVAMESTGVYRKPVFHLLEDRFGILLVDAHHITQVPGRRTDVKDCQWIAQLPQHGLLRASVVPPQPIRESRDLTRQRSQLVGERASVSNRIRKVFEDANIKLAGVASDILGVPARNGWRRIRRPDRGLRSSELRRRRARSAGASPTKPGGSKIRPGPGLIGVRGMRRETPQARKRKVSRRYGPNGGGDSPSPRQPEFSEQQPED